MIKTGYHPHETAGDANQDAQRIMREEKGRYGGGEFFQPYLIGMITSC